MIPTEPGYHLTWHDEFDYTGLPDPKKWGNEEGKVRNQEMQYYTANRLENSYVKGGMLTIEGRHEPFKGSDYTSSSLITEGKFSFLYGRLEVKAKLPGGSGTWPAIWMMGIDRKAVGWPKCGEIDVMEHVAFQPDKIFGTIHLPSEQGKRDFSKGDHAQCSTCTSAFHVYRLDWSREALKFYLDGHLYFTYVNDGPNRDVFNRPMYLLLNLAIGGEWGGQKGVDPSVYPQMYEIKYVRVWQKNNSAPSKDLPGSEVSPK